MSDDYLQRLHIILSSVEGDTLYNEITTWNDKLEILWSHPDGQSSFPPLITDLVRKVSESLLCICLELLQGQSLQKSLENLANQSATKDNVPQPLDAVLHRWKDDQNSVTEKIKWLDLSLFIRTMKNWWRWYLQIYLSRHGKEVEVARPQIENPWRSVAMLELLLLLMEAFVNHSTIQPVDSALSDRVHHVANLLFYITYPSSSHDTVWSESYQHLISNGPLLSRLLSLLIRPDVGMSLRLSILRNVHSALVSFPKLATDAAAKASISSNEASIPDWMHPNDSKSLTYTSVLPDLLIHTLTFPKYDTESWDDSRNAELVVETLHCCYALNITLDPRWHDIFDTILQRDASQDPPFLDCQCAALPMLMDAPRAFREHLSEPSVLALVQILEHQVTKVVVQDRCVDDRAAAALNPILAVLYKLCVEHRTVAMAAIRPRVFPDWDARRAPSTVPKNMSPVDAPEGTLRWKLIQLLTWPQGYVKRLAGELLFVLCDGQQQEFIYRVGMGNAVAFLSVKGLIQLPGSVHS